MFVSSYDVLGITAKQSNPALNVANMLRPLEPMRVENAGLILVVKKIKYLDINILLNRKIAADVLLEAICASEDSVQYAGPKIEEQPVGPLFDRPHHLYTVALLDVLPERATDRLLSTIPGVVSGQFDRSSGSARSCKSL